MSKSVRFMDGPLKGQSRIIDKYKPFIEAAEVPPLSLSSIDVQKEVGYEPLKTVRYVMSSYNSEFNGYTAVLE